MTDDMVNEINELGGNFTKENFLGYTVLEHNVTRSEYKGFPLLSTPPPGSGAILSMILSVLEGELRCTYLYTYHFAIVFSLITSLYTTSLPPLFPSFSLT